MFFLLSPAALRWTLLKGSYELIISGTEGWKKKRRVLEEHVSKIEGSKTASMWERRKQSYSLFSCCETAPEFKSVPRRLFFAAQQRIAIT